MGEAGDWWSKEKRKRRWKGEKGEGGCGRLRIRSDRRLREQMCQWSRKMREMRERREGELTGSENGRKVVSTSGFLRERVLSSVCPGKRVSEKSTP